VRAPFGTSIARPGSTASMPPSHGSWTCAFGDRPVSVKCHTPATVRSAEPTDYRTNPEGRELATPGDRPPRRDDFIDPHARRTLELCSATDRGLDEATVRITRSGRLRSNRRLYVRPPPPSSPQTLER